MLCQPRKESAYQPAPLPLPQLELVERFGVPFLTDPVLFEACGTRIAFTQRASSCAEADTSSLDIARGPRPQSEAAARNRLLILRAMDVPSRVSPLAVPNQVHGDKVVVLGDSSDQGCPLPRELESGCDGVVCTVVDQPVALSFADCTPVVIVAPNGAFAIAHAGWRGALAGISGKAARVLAESTGLLTSSFSAYIGPHVCSACYGVSSDLSSLFIARFGPVCVQGCNLSLSAAVRADLAEVGIVSIRIVDAVADRHLDACTKHHQDLYFSYRAEGEHAGRHGAFACRLKTVSSPGISALH